MRVDDDRWLEVADAFGAAAVGSGTWLEGLSALASITGSRAGELRSEEHTSELQSRPHLVCRLLLEKKNLLRREGRADMSADVMRPMVTADSIAAMARRRERAALALRYVALAAVGFVMLYPILWLVG